MDKIDPRIVRVGVQVKDEMRYYEELAIVASGTKFANANENECDIKITNLSKETRDYILTETSPFLKSKKPKQITLEAGRVSTGYSVVFVGDIISAVPSQPPDIALTIKAKTKSHAKTDVVAKSKAKKMKLSSLSKDIAKDLDLKLVFEAKDKMIENYSFTGSNLKQVDELARMGLVNAFVDDDKLIVKNTNEATKGDMQILNLDTGMIGIPEIDEHGVKVKYLYNNHSKVGGALKIESKLNPAANGVYSIYKLSFDIANRDNNFYLSAEAKRIKDGK